MSKNCPGGINGRALVDASRPVAKSLRFDCFLTTFIPPLTATLSAVFRQGRVLLGHNLLAKMLSRISEKSNCSKKRLCLRNARVMLYLRWTILNSFLRFCFPFPNFFHSLTDAFPCFFAFFQMHYFVLNWECVDVKMVS